jgi:hypothetical protein
MRGIGSGGYKFILEPYVLIGFFSRFTDRPKRFVRARQTLLLRDA